MLACRSCVETHSMCGARNVPSCSDENRVIALKHKIKKKEGTGVDYCQDLVFLARWQEEEGL